MCLRHLRHRSAALSLPFLACVIGLGACQSGGTSDASGGDNGAGGTSASGGAASGGTGNPADGGSPGAGGLASGGQAASGGEGGEGAAPQAGGSPGSGGAGTGGAPSGTGGDAALDPFGITQLYPSSSPERAWTSAHWDLGESYTMAFGEDDRDPQGLSGMRGDGALTVSGTGELTLSGAQPRIYVYADDSHVWQNIEVTVYYQRVEDTGTAYAGLVVGVHSGRDGHNTSTACDAHTYYARLRHDGDIDFEKELKHPASSTGSKVDAEDVWPPDGVLPTGRWIGWKFVIYATGPDSVKLEAYRDLSHGEDGGDWQLVNEQVDAGGWFVETDCAEHAPTNGQSDLVVTAGGAVLVRNTDIVEARYRWFSVREITPP